MKYTTLGTAGAKVSKLCLGTMNFGSSTDKQESFSIMDFAIENGINFFDTADFYGTPAGKGITEEIVGEWFKTSGNRDRTVLVTKAYATMGRMEINDRGNSAYHLRRACNDSLKRLQTDHIDVYMLHHYDRGFRFSAELANIGQTEEFDLVPSRSGSLAPTFDETLEALERLKQQDKITYIGTANFPAWGIAHFNGVAKLKGMSGTAVEQCCYNLNTRNAEIEILPACRELGVGVMNYSPLAGGVLGGFKAATKRSRFDPNSLDPKLIEKMKNLDKLCEEIGENPSDVALAWCLNNPDITSVILGPRTKVQLENSLRAVDIALPIDFTQKLDEIFKGPGKEAPEYYAW